MATKALRQRRMDYVRSDAIETPEGTVYHVMLQPKKGEPPVTALEMATQRDFTIGISAASLTLLTIVGFTGGVGLGLSALIVGAGAALGAASDYTRNKRELEDGVIIGKPQPVNRDTVKTALSWGFLAKVLVMGAAVVGAVTGLNVPGAELFEQAWTEAASNGLPSQIGAVMKAVPASVDMLAFGAGSAYGASKGAHVGIERMKNEYEKAQVKHQRPNLIIESAMEKNMGVGEAIVNVVAPAVTGGIASEFLNAASAAKTEIDGHVEHRETEKENQDGLVHSFVKAEEMRRDAGKAAIVEHSI